MSITTETRREAYESIAPQMTPRQKMIYDALQRNGPSTAEEIADFLFREGKIPYANRTFTAPRLTELSDASLVKPVSRRESRISGRKIAVWDVTEP